jgi:hypothetical protein
MLGKTISHYEVIEELGVGGNGCGLQGPLAEPLPVQAV